MGDHALSASCSLQIVSSGAGLPMEFQTILQSSDMPGESMDAPSLLGGTSEENGENEAGPFEEELRNVGAGNDYENDSLSMEEDNTLDHTAKLRENLRTQIAAMCEQLSDLGEECMFLSLNPSDQVCQHTGSIKGDQFCLLRPELVKDFTNFCLAYENSALDNTADDESLFPRRDGRNV